MIVDLGGRIVGRFSGVDPEEPIWDGTDGGSAVAPGLYVVRVQGPRGTESVGLAVLDGDCDR